ALDQRHVPRPGALPPGGPSWRTAGPCGRAGLAGRARAVGAPRPGARRDSTEFVAGVVARSAALPAVRLRHDAGVRHPRQPALPLLHVLGCPEARLAHLPVEIGAGSAARTLCARPDRSARSGTRSAVGDALSTGTAPAAGCHPDRLRWHDGP